MTILPLLFMEKSFCIFIFFMTKIPLINLQPLIFEKKKILKRIIFL